VKPALPTASLELYQFEQIVVFPWFGIDTELTEDLTIGLAFVVCFSGAGICAAAAVRESWQNRCQA